MAPKEVVRQFQRLSQREREILQLRCEAIEIKEQLTQQQRILEQGLY
jgi:hypothetical protein